MRKYKDRLVSTLMKFLTQGLTPQKLAFTLALGITLGIFPVIGPVTGMCILAAFLFRLNQAALQFVNYIVYPFQIICLIPFYNLGAFLFNDSNFKLSLTSLKQKFSQDILATLVELWSATWHAAVAWLIVAPILVGLIYYSCYPMLKRMGAKRKKSFS
jgi:uncharacterized protein (DUF2062 family)